MLLWCFCFLGSIPGAAGNHYRYQWRSCYPCYLGRAGYSVGHAEMRPGTCWAQPGVGWCCPGGGSGGLGDGLGAALGVGS